MLAATYEHHFAAIQRQCLSGKKDDVKMEGIASAIMAAD